MFIILFSNNVNDMNAINTCNMCNVSERSGICNSCLSCCIFARECDNILSFICARYIKKYEYKNGFYTDSPYLSGQNSFKVKILNKNNYDGVIISIPPDHCKNIGREKPNVLTISLYKNDDLVYLEEFGHTSINVIEFTEINGYEGFTDCYIAYELVREELVWLVEYERQQQS